jgi:hypothetical protein
MVSAVVKQVKQPGYTARHSMFAHPSHTTILPGKTMLDKQQQTAPIQLLRNVSRAWHWYEMLNGMDVFVFRDGSAIGYIVDRAPTAGVVLSEAVHTN